MNGLTQMSVLLGASVVGVTVARRLGLGSVLGYVVAGAVVGPSGAAVVRDAEQVLHVAELGVVLMLFVIGLGLRPARLWSMRRDVFGLGSLQVVATGALFAAIGRLAGIATPEAIVVGLGLALSSTALVMQVLAERAELTTPHGRKAFGILLFQDLAALPLLAIVPALADRGGDAGGPSLAVGAAAFAAVLLVGRLGLRPLFAYVTRAGSHELNTVTALFVVAATALAMAAAGLSMALGAFAAGVLLAESEYRHELEADIEPFKGLLLGLFFMAVGMSIDPSAALDRPLALAALVVGLVAGKALVLLAVARVAGLGGDGATTLAVGLAQGGEFAFVIFGVAGENGLISHGQREVLVLAVALSMLATPLLLVALDRARRARGRDRSDPVYDVVRHDGRPVVIAGFGRYGQIVSRILRSKRIPFTALEINPAHVEFVRRFGNEIHYGDAARVDLLRAAGAATARALVVAVDDPEAAVRIVEAARASFPALAVLARARNRDHAHALRAAGAQHVLRDTLGSSLETGQALLETLGLGYAEAAATVRRFREHDEALLERQYAIRDDRQALMASAKEAAAQLERLFEDDRR